MIEHVELGQKITAYKQNQIIDAVNYKLNSGDIFNSDLDNSYRFRYELPPTFLQCATVYSLKLSERPATFDEDDNKLYLTVKINLGTDIVTAKESVLINGEKVDQILLLSKNHSDLNFVLSANDFQLSVLNDLSATHKINDGWIDTGVYKELIEGKITSIDIIGTVCKVGIKELNNKGDEIITPKWMFIVSDKFDKEQDLINAIKNTLNEIDIEIKNVEIYDKFLIASHSIKNGYGLGVYTQLNLGLIYRQVEQRKREPWDVDLATLSVYNPSFTIGSHNGYVLSDYAHVANISGDNYCVMDLEALSGCICAEPFEDPVHASIKVFSVTTVSSEVSSYNENGVLEKHKEEKQYVDYYTRYPNINCWEYYSL